MTLDALDDLNRTAWLTAWCHHACGASWGLHRPVSDWLIQRLGPPPFAPDLSFFTRHGIAARAAWIDARIVEILEGQGRGPVEIWSIGAGFDSRWQWLLAGRHPQIARYREFDLGHVLDAKHELLAGSPWAALWNRVERHRGDVVAGLPESLPATSGNVLIVTEGLLDYLDCADKRALLAAIRARAPRACLLLDAQNRWLLERNNKGTRRATGSTTVRFAWAPDDPCAFYGRCSGYEIVSHHVLIRDLMRRRWPVTRWLPLPKKLREGYNLLHLRSVAGWSSCGA